MRAELWSLRQNGAKHLHNDDACNLQHGARPAERPALSERERTNRAIKDTWQRLVEQNPQMLTQANVRTQRQQELQQHQAMWPPVRMTQKGGHFPHAARVGEGVQSAGQAVAAAAGRKSTMPMHI